MVFLRYKISKMNKLIMVVLMMMVGQISFSQAPRITYAEPEREDSRRTEFDIIGKVNGNFLIYKNNRSSYAVSVYNEDMELKNSVKLDYLPDRLINVDFINYPEFVYMIYQYQRKNVVYCSAVKLDGEGKNMEPPFNLDTTELGFASSNKIYTTLFSDDKQRIMIFKINSLSLIHI